MKRLREPSSKKSSVHTSVHTSVSFVPSVVDVSVTSENLCYLFLAMTMTLMPHRFTGHTP
jgi:hypothetical protein